MFWWIRELLSSISFIFIKGDNSFWQSKRMYEIVIPVCFSSVAFALYLTKPDFFATDFLSKLSGSLFQFMVFVVPFHLAALAAIATFTRKGLDSPLKGVNASLKVWDNDENTYYLKDLTLRQYTCLLFGYLCTLGVFYILFYVLVSGLNLEAIFGDYITYLRQATVLYLFLFLSHYGVLSVYSISFLFDKVNETRS